LPFSSGLCCFVFVLGLVSVVPCFQSDLFCVEWDINLNL